MPEVNLEKLACARHMDPMNTWPDHIAAHRCTLLRNPLFDYDCLRCWLERMAVQALEEKEKAGADSNTEGG